MRVVGFSGFEDVELMHLIVVATLIAIKVAAVSPPIFDKVWFVLSTQIQLVSKFELQNFFSHSR